MNDSDTESDDDIPLGQRHPDALKAQAKLRSQPTKISNTKTPIQNQNQQLKDHHNQDQDDNQPLVFLKRHKSLSKPCRIPTQINPDCPISADQLIQKLKLVQNLALKPSVLQPKQHSNTSSHLPPIDTRRPDPTTLQEPLPGHKNHSDLLKSPTHQISPTSHFPNLADQTTTTTHHNHKSHHHAHPPASQSKQVSSRQPKSSSSSIEHELNPSTQNITSSLGLRRGKTTNRSGPQAVVSSSTQLRKSSDEHHRPARTQSLSRAKSLSDKHSNSAQNSSFLNHLPPIPTANLHLLTQPPQNSSTQQLEPKSPVSKPSPSHLNTQLESHHYADSQTHSPIELSPSHKKKYLIKLAIVHLSQSIMVEINQDTLPKDLLKVAEESGQLIDEHTKGTWGVFEVWRDLEIERPVREIEKVIKIVETWTSVDTNETYLMIQKNELSGLSISKRSITSGQYGGNLWCELKPGKWTKKYVLLKDNSIYLCSNDKGKDEIFLCTMEKFDVFSIPSWAHKNLKGVPREHSFGVKSLNKFSFFETKSDFVHKFSCKNNLLHLEWIRRLYDARTYIIMSQSGGEDLGRTKSTESGHARTQAEKTKPMGLKRGQTLLANHKSGGRDAIPVPEIGNRAELSGRGGGSNLGRKPTLIQASTLSKFKQGTLLGNLGDTATTANGSSQLEDLKTSLSAILPAHVMPLSTNEAGAESVGPEDGQKHETGKPHRPTPARTWEQMGPDERKLYLNQVQHQAKLEGRTLLHFSDPSKPAPGGLLAGLAPAPSSAPAPAGLNRSKTLGSQSRPSRRDPSFGHK